MADKEAGDLAETGGQGVPPLPEPDVEQGSRWLPSLVWLIPLLAALIGAGGFGQALGGPGSCAAGRKIGD